MTKINTGGTMTPQDAAPKALILEIATRHFFVETLETRKSDQLDFHDVAVWAMRAALEEAFEAGRRAAPDLHRIATEQAAEIGRLLDVLEDAEYDLAQWCECAPELIKAGFNMDGTADVLAKVSAALQVQP